MTKFKSDEQDLANLRNTYDPTWIRCAGGRLIHPGYICLHCGSQDPQRECDSPKPESGND